MECGDNRPKRANYGVVCAGHGWHWLEPISRLIAPQAAEGREGFALAVEYPNLAAEQSDVSSTGCPILCQTWMI